MVSEARPSRMRHQLLETLGRGGQQQRRAGRAAEHSHRCQRFEPGRLTLQLGTGAEHAADAAEHQRDGVRHIGRDRRQADGQQRRVGRQRCEAGNRAEQATGNAGDDQQAELEWRHPMMLSVQLSLRPGSLRVGLTASRGIEPIRPSTSSCEWFASPR